MKFKFMNKYKYVLLLIPLIVIIYFIRYQMLFDIGIPERYLEKNISKLHMNSYDLLKSIDIDNDHSWILYENDTSHVQIILRNSVIKSIYILSNNLQDICLSDTSDSSDISFSRMDGYNKTIYRTSEGMQRGVLVTSIENNVSYGIISTQMLSIINFERRLLGIEGLKIDMKLSQIATDYCFKMNEYDFFSHFDNDGNTVSERVNQQLRDIKYLVVGENLVRGENMSVYEAHNKLMNSFGHKKNILGDYSRIGIGGTISDEITYICQIFVE